MSLSDDCCSKATALSSSSHSNSASASPATLTSSDLLSSITCAFEITASTCDSNDQQETYETLRRHHSSEETTTSGQEIFTTNVQTDQMNSNSVSAVIQNQFANVYNISGHNNGNNSYYDQYEYTNGHTFASNEATWLTSGRNEDSSLDLSHHHAHHAHHSSQHLNYPQTVADISTSHAFPLNASAAAAAASAAYYGDNSVTFTDGASNLLPNYWPVSQVQQCSQSSGSNGTVCSSTTNNNFTLNNSNRVNRRTSSKRVNVDNSPVTSIKLRKNSRSNQSATNSTCEVTGDIESKFAMTVEFLKSCNLYDITMRTAEFNRHNCQLQEQIDSLRDEMTNSAHLYST